MTNPSANCPNCQQLLNKLPTRKTKCPKCGDFMYLKYRPGEDRSQKRLVGAKEAEEIELDWNRTQAIDQEIRIGQDLSNLMQTGDARQIALAKVIWARHFKPDLALGLEREHCRLSILEFADSSEYAGIEVIANTPQCCELCKALAGKIFSVKTALKKCVFPLDGCVGRPCCAWISPVYLDEAVIELTDQKANPKRPLLPKL